MASGVELAGPKVAMILALRVLRMSVPLSVMRRTIAEPGRLENRPIVTVFHHPGRVGQASGWRQWVSRIRTEATSASVWQAGRVARASPQASAE